MPRIAIRRSETGIYHVMLRGINKQLIFESEDDKSRFIAIISEYDKSERFKSECVEDDNYFINVLRYIHQNPVKVGMVKTVEKYKWSSYNPRNII